MASRPMTLRDVAAQLGVHYMTAYRYVRLGQLEATKEGATWRVAPGALEAFLGDPRGRPPVRPEPACGEPTAGLTAPAGRNRPVDWSARYEARLLGGDHVGAFAVLEAALVAGNEVDEVLIDVVTAALHRIGVRWACGQIDVADEHLASVIVRQHLGRLSPLCTRRGRSRGTVLVGCAPGERHDLGATVVVALVRLAGFDAVDLGADVPAASFAVAAGRADRLVAVGVSLNSPIGCDGVRAAADAVRAAAPAVPILVGGPGVAGVEHARALGADAYASDGRAVVRWLEELAPRRLRRPSPAAESSTPAARSSRPAVGGSTPRAGVPAPMVGVGGSTPVRRAEEGWAAALLGAARV
jgi:excisionase family DNA binding protein